MSKAPVSAPLGFAPLLEKYFLAYMIRQKNSSPRTISSYRDSFLIYFAYLSDKHGIGSVKVEMTHFALDYLSGFIEYLEQSRNSSATTINLRISAIKSFLRYASAEAPEYSGLIRKSLSLPTQKADKPVMTFLSKKEYEAMISVCEGNSRLDARDKLILMVMYNTGCRVSELVNLHVSDIVLSDAAGTSYINFYGKGRKERSTPIWKSTARYIEEYISTLALSKENHLFKNTRNEKITRSGVSQRICVISKKASDICPSLKEKKITPHTFRHSVAMNLLQAGIDISTIAIWLGHESIETTHKYMVADIELKRKAMEKMKETGNDSFNYKPSKSIMAFLNSL